MSDINVPSHWQCFLTAVQFLTRVPTSEAMGSSAESYRVALRRAVVYFPVVGGMVGICTGSIFVAGVSIGFTPLLSALVAVGLEAVLTGAFHEDAFADTWDALGGGWTRDQLLEIMKDSRLGTYGTISLIIGVGIRVAAIAACAELGLLWSMAVIVAAASLGRVAIVGLMACTSPIEDRHTQAKDVSGAQSVRTLVVASLISVPLWLPILVIRPAVGLSSIIAAIVVLVWYRRKILQRVGGTTGDLLGCSAFLVQLVILIGASVAS
jgi:adenosylcobinamide-GDP ribazoletransferase